MIDSSKIDAIFGPPLDFQSQSSTNSSSMIIPVIALATFAVITIVIINEHYKNEAEKIRLTYSNK